MMWRLRKRLGKILIAVSAGAGAGLVLQGCATMTHLSATGTSPPGEFCLIASPLTWNKSDSDGTILEIKRYNAVGIALCGWGK